MKLTKLVIPLICGLLTLGCGESKEPKKEDFQRQDTTFTRNYKLVDVENDGEIDEIYNKRYSLSTPIYVAEDSDSAHKFGIITKKMGIDLRSSATALHKATQNYEFDLAKQKYEDWKEKQND